MKIPDSVRISGAEYRVETVENLRDSSRLLCGSVRFSECKIYLSATDCQSHEFRCIVLWHEILHAIIEDRDLELDSEVEEKLCEALSRGIYQVLQDNGGKLFDLQPGPEALSNAGSFAVGTPGTGGRGYTDRHGNNHYIPDLRGCEEREDKQHSER